MLMKIAQVPRLTEDSNEAVCIAYAKSEPSKCSLIWPSEKLNFLFRAIVIKKVWEKEGSKYLGRPPG